MRLSCATFLCTAAFLLAGCSINGKVSDVTTPQVERPTLAVREIDTDFQVDGTGSAPQWQTAEWVNLNVIRGPSTYSTKVKTLYSNTGMYFLFDCEDTKLTATITEDYGLLYNEDVVEVFLWPEESQRVYLEYEISPLNYELPLMVVKGNGFFQGWRPWLYDSGFKIRHAVSIRGGEMVSGAKVEGWTAEFYIPFLLIRGLRNLPPVPGTRWRANMTRVDYDKSVTHWSWCHLGAPNFHWIDEFNTLVFE